MGWFAWILDKLDPLLTWWDQLSQSEWIRWGVGTITFYLFTIWARFTGQPLITIVVEALGGAAFLVILFTYLPPFLRKYRSPSLAITVFAPVFSRQKTSMYMFILNKSPHNRAFVETLLYVPLSNGKELQASSDWISDKTVQQGRSIQHGPQELGPQEADTNLLTFTLPPPPYGSTPLFTEAYLQVIDYMSGRSAKVKIPGKFPPE